MYMGWNGPAELGFRDSTVQDICVSIQRVLSYSSIFSRVETVKQISLVGVIRFRSELQPFILTLGSYPVRFGSRIVSLQSFLYLLEDDFHESL